MHSKLPRCRQKLVASALIIGAALLAFARRAGGFTPESPEVRQAVAKAIRFLETNQEYDENGQKPGGKALVAMAILKHGGDPGHVRIREAVEKIRQHLGNLDPKSVGLDIYSTGLSAIFLIELDPSTYEREIQCLMQSLVRRQKAQGGWGYPSGPHQKTCDTSMTQYAVLSSWEAIQAGFDLNLDTIDNVAGWLVRTQDPSGGFGYQGIVATPPMRVAQGQVRLSLTAAGLGSLYICSDLLGFSRRIEPSDEGLPPALKVIEREQPDAGLRPKTRVSPAAVHRAQLDGNRFVAINYRIDPHQWTHYYLYALERYMSFRELAEKDVAKNSGRAANWYDDGVRYLLATQMDDGSWSSQCGKVCDTAFGVLFLLRSTQKRIQKVRNFGDGTLIGGRGLPKETEGAQVRQGQVVARPLLGPAEELLAALENPDSQEYEGAIELLAQLPTEKAEELVGKQAKRLRELAGGRSPEGRIAAVRTLGKSRHMDSVPTLIYALTDPDARVVMAARDALRRISRRPKGFGLPEQPNAAELRAGIEAWKRWYLAVRPDAEFEN